MVETGALRPDDHQTKIIQILQDLYNKLLEYSPPSLPIVTETKSLVRLHLGPLRPELN
jgi:protein AFG1